MKLNGVVIGQNPMNGQEKGLEYVQQQLRGTKLSKHCDLIYETCLELRTASDETLFPRLSP